MSRSLCRRTTLVLLLLTVLTAPLASAAEKAPPRAASPSPIELLSRAWSLLASLWGEEGCSGDPDGRCTTKSVSLWNEEGCTGDPNGRCVTMRVQVAPPKVHVDTGCIGDPDGRCTP